MISSALRSRLPRDYRPLFERRGPFRRLLPAFAVSDLGDGMSVVAVAWLALQLAPPGGSGLLVGAAVAAYVLPGAAGGLLLGRWLRGLPARRLIRADAWTRAVLLGCVPLAWALGVLGPALYLALLAGSSLLHAWGSSAKYALVAEAVPPGQRLAANVLLSTSTWVATVAGPALAGALAVAVAPAWLIGLDALSFAVLAVLAVRSGRPDGREVGREEEGREDGVAAAVAPPAGPRRSGEGLRVLRTRPGLLGLLALTWLFNLFYGPVEVALPLFVGQDLHAGPGLLGLYWTAFGLGAALGTLAVGALRRLPVWPMLLGIVAAHGLAMLPFALHGPSWPSVVGFALAGVVYGPYSALALSLFQDGVPPAALTAVLALRASVLLTAGPVGTALGGPLTAVLGPRQVLVGAGLAMAAVAVGAAVVRVRSLARGRIPSPAGLLRQETR
ncbi:MFS transporter [Kitasatospora sp. NPDC058201]|uniref:MFS transporter n=1 Tax=unclassified Kitasatospora TaxID=2633591 RepID=UPI0036515C27